jgi:hypothetical protein
MWKQTAAKKRAAVMEPDPTRRATILALRARFDSASKSMRDLEREMASLNASDRRERMREFDARVMALMKEGEHIAMSVRAFLRPGDHPSGHA